MCVSVCAVCVCSVEAKEKTGKMAKSSQELLGVQLTGGEGLASLGSFELLFDLLYVCV